MAAVLYRPSSSSADMATYLESGKEPSSRSRRTPAGSNAYHDQYLPSSDYSSYGYREMSSPLGNGYQAEYDNELSMDPYDTSIIVIHGLPHSVPNTELRKMFIFLKDFDRISMSSESYPQDQPGVTRSVKAYFRNVQASVEAKEHINNRAQEIFEGFSLRANLLPEAMPSNTSRRHMGSDARYRPSTGSNSNSSSSSSTNGRTSSGRHHSNHASDPLSPRNIKNGAHGVINGNHELNSFAGAPHEFSIRPSSASIHDNYLNHSISRANMSLGPSSGKALLLESENENNDEYDTLLNEPARYLYYKNSSNNEDPLNLRETTPRRATLNSRFGALSLDTNNLPSSINNGGITSAPPVAAPASNQLASPVNMPLSATQTPGYLNYPRILPAANPADQNPPCNTLYVGNLPMNTSEDELKALFSRQRGYKRLCFRTKSNGPMCFVEFEDVAYATRALTELYGRGLSNSIKGGIRLSFSKNPLGVRSGQPGQSGSLHSGSGRVDGYHTATHAPPGLPHPAMVQQASRTMSFDLGSPNSGSNGSPPSATFPSNQSSASLRDRTDSLYSSPAYSPGYGNNVRERDYLDHQIEQYAYESPSSSGYLVRR